MAPALEPRRSVRFREKPRGVERERSFLPLEEVARILYALGPGGSTMTKTNPL